MPRPNQPTIEETMSAFLRSLAGANKSQATITAYRIDLAQFSRYLAETNLTIASPADIRRGDIAEYLASLADRETTGTTRARKLSSIREYFRFLEVSGLVEKNPTLGIATPKKERS